MILRIDLHEQEYNGSKYYKTNIRYIHQDEQIQPKLESLRDKVVERIKGALRGVERLFGRMLTTVNSHQIGVYSALFTV
jgi:hypothetical protein